MTIDRSGRNKYPTGVNIGQSLVTDRGMVREHNEDAVGHSEEIGLYILGDGMGGAQAGRLRAGPWCRKFWIFAEFELKKAGDGKAITDAQYLNILTEAFQKANHSIYDLSQKDRTKRGMGTTAVAVWVRNGKAYMTHVGDSRIYLLRGKKLHQLTEDHSRVNEMVKQGVITAEQARYHPARNVITRAIGTQDSIKMDTLVKDIQEGDTFLLCSDGLSNKVDPDVIEMALLQAGVEEQKARHLVDLANEAGGEDNISVVLVRCGGVEAVTAVEPGKMKWTAADIKVFPIFKEMIDPVINEMVNISEIKISKAGETIIKEGDTEDALYVIVKGGAKVVKLVDPERGIQKEMAELYPGDFFGEMSLVDKKPRSASVVAKYDSTLFRLTSKAFNQFLKQNPEHAVSLLFGIMRTMSRRMRSMDEEIVRVFRDRGKSAKDVQELQEILSAVFCRVMTDKDTVPPI